MQPKLYFSRKRRLSEEDNLQLINHGPWSIGRLAKSRVLLYGWLVFANQLFGELALMAFQRHLALSPEVLYQS
jgi:hypothetical protein